MKICMLLVAQTAHKSN